MVQENTKAEKETKRAILQTTAELALFPSGKIYQ